MYKTHGMTNTSFYEVWHHMKQRCNGTSDDVANKNYYQRGINYQPNWKTFENFYNDMFEDYQKLDGENKKLSLDRIDNNKGYSKTNCRWVSFKENNNNKRGNVLIRGKTISYWCDHYGYDKSMRARVYKRWSAYKIRDFDILFDQRRTTTIRAIKKSTQPCVKCGTTGGTIRKEGGYPVRKKGLCNTCYCRRYRTKNLAGYAQCWERLEDHE